MENLIEYWKGVIERDLTPFVDPGSNLSLSVSGRVIAADWQQSRRMMTASFVLSQSGAETSVDFSGKKYTYESFFACEEMADLLALAKMIVQVSKQSVYVHTKAVASVEPNIEIKGLATDVVRNSLPGAEEDLGTTVIMVTGEAGAGKTSALKQLVREQADLYTRGKSKYLFLYVDAQGRALARFNEALATELNDLRVHLTYHAVSTLVRLGLIVPIIDGFDELIGVGGYDDAFGSISMFIEELDGLGSLVASARSTYYEQEFLARTNRPSSPLGVQAWRLKSIEVLEWLDEERIAYVQEIAEAKKLSNQDAQELLKKVNGVFSGANKALANKPLFVVRTVDFLLAGEDISAEENLLDQLVSVFIGREQKDKLLSKSAMPILGDSQLRSLCSDIAEEMWNQGTRELDRGSVKELAELALLDVNIPKQDKIVVVERMPSFAFLQPGEGKGFVTFEHEIFFSYFLAARFATRIKNNNYGGISLLLGRSVVPEALADRTAETLIDDTDGPSIQGYVKRLCDAAAAKSLRQSQVQENAGTLVASVIRATSVRDHAISNWSLADVVIPGSSLRDVNMVDCSFANIEFRRVDFSGAKLRKCKSNSCLYFGVLVDSETVLDVDGASDREDFIGLRMSTGGSISQLFDPLEIKKCLGERGLPSAKEVTVVPMRNVRADVIALIARFSKEFLKRNPVCIDDEVHKTVYAGSDWPRIQKILLEAGVIKEEVRSVHGPRKTFLRRLVNYEEIIAGARKDVPVSPEVNRMWDMLEQRFPDKP